MPQRVRPTAVRLIALAIASTISCASLADNEPLPANRAEPITDPDVGAIMSGLRSRDFFERERASIDLQRMVETSRLTEPELIALASRPDNTPEQRTRILDQAMLRFKQSERAGMGIGWRPVTGWGAILTEVRSNFPVAEHLAKGDVIQSIDGMSLIAPAGVPDNETWNLIAIIRSAIVSHDPGESVRVIFRRPPVGQAIDAGNLQLPIPEFDPTDWEVRTADVPLGSFSRLAPGNALSQLELDAAWMQRLGRLLPVDQSEWAAIEVSQATQQTSKVPGSIRDNQVSSLTGRSTLRDRAFMTRRYAINNQQTQQALLMARTAQQPRGVQLRTTANTGQDGSGLSSPFGDADLPDLEAITSLDTQIRLVEHQIAQAVANEAPQELLDELRARHKQMCARLAEIAGRQPTR